MSVVGRQCGFLKTSSPDVSALFAVNTYTGNGAARSLTNSVDLVSNGGAMWIKSRTSTTSNNNWVDTVRGSTTTFFTDSTSAETTVAQGVTAFNSGGFSLGTNSGFNANGEDFVAWTLRKSPRFFDCGSYVGTGASRTVAHNLGVIPGLIFIKRRFSTSPWSVYHSGLANTKALVLNSTAGAVTDTTLWDSTSATTSVFSLGSSTDVNASGATYMYYAFAHDTSGDGISYCGSWSTDSTPSPVTVSTGWTPQAAIWKSTVTGQISIVVDTARGWSASQHSTLTFSQVGAQNATDRGAPTATGFTVPAVGLLANDLYVYWAVRAPY